MSVEASGDKEDHKDLKKVIIEDYGKPFLWPSKAPDKISTQYLKCANINVLANHEMMDCSHISSVLDEVVHKHKFQLNQECALLVNITNDGCTIKKFLILQSEDSVKSTTISESFSVSNCMVVYYNEVIVCIVLGNTM